MSIKRYTASQDTTITNALDSTLSTRGTGSNMGESDITEVFSIYSQVSSSTDGNSIEKSRVLYRFPIDEILQDRTNEDLPTSGNVNFQLRIFNAIHSQTLPKKFKLIVAAVSQSWDEGYGMDMESYTDIGTANWISCSATEGWDTEGGTFLTASQYLGEVYTQEFEDGTEDLDIDITSLVEKWISNEHNNYGLAVYLTSSQEDGTEERSYYTKKFFARGSEFFNKKPVIEARWNSQLNDDSTNFYLSSSLVPAEDNLNTLFFYNKPRGQYQNIPSVGKNNLLLSLHSSLGSGKISLPIGGGVVTNNDLNITGSWVSEGIYSASFAYTGSSTTIYPVWHSGSVEYFSGSAITVNSFNASQDNSQATYITKVKNSKSSHSRTETVRVRLFTRRKDWSPTIYTRAVTTVESEPIEKVFYSVYRVVDELEIIGYGTGSTNHTLMSYDSKGNYFDLDMSLFESGYLYETKFLFNIDGIYKEQPETFKFRVE